MKRTQWILVLWVAGASCLAASGGTPKIQFEKTTYDFGKISHVTTVSGAFKFKNAGDAVLKLEPPKPSCGCTVAELKPDTLPPGAAGELPFSLHLGPSRAIMEKHIIVRSNDPQAPEISLTIKVDYTPLYELTPMTLSPTLAFGVNDAVQFTTLARTDGKPLRIARIDASKPWIKAIQEPTGATNEASARIRVSIQRDGPPRRFNEYVHIYGPEQTNSPISSLYLYGNMMGEVSLSPEALYWSITDGAKTSTERPEAMVLRRVTVRAASGKEIELRNLQSTVQGIKLELVPKEAGKVYELVARLDDIPANTISGNLSFETSVAAQSKIEVPIIVNVFKP